MSNLITIVLFLLFLFVSGYLVFSKNNIITKLRRQIKQNEKVGIEDALKQLYDYEYTHKSATLDTLAGGLSLSKNATALLIEKLEQMKLSINKNGIISLTSEGRSYALRIIRIHRLWERYLADETSLKEVDWHENAEHIEHEMTITEADRLAARIGNPVFDPHGDPIPTAEGFMPKLSGVLLTELNEGDFATIIHLEDEPLAIYSQLMAIGLYSGMQIQVIEKSLDKIKFLKEGDEAVLAPIFANNIMVRKEENAELKITNYPTLSSLEKGESAEIVSISGNCRGRQRRRIMDFGLLPGTLVTAEMVSPLGDPKAYLVRGTKIAIRKDQAQQIFINKEILA